MITLRGRAGLFRLISFKEFSFNSLLILWGVVLCLQRCLLLLVLVQFEYVFMRLFETLDGFGSYFFE